MTKLLFIVAGLALVAIVIVMARSSIKEQEDRHGESETDGSATWKDNNGKEIVGKELSIKGKRVAVLKSAIKSSLKEAAKEDDGTETAEENMIRRLKYLDEILLAEESDNEYRKRIMKEIVEAVWNNELKKTRVADVVCGGSLCKIEFFHDDGSGHRELLDSRVMEEGSWGHEGAGREYQEEGNYYTVLYFGKKGNKLPKLPAEVKARR